MITKGQTGLYIHWPFCLSKCPYCDFNVHVDSGVDQARWCAAYLKSLEHVAGLTEGRIISSIFFGGGTPSLMLPSTIAAIIDKIHALWPCVNDLEVTLEANPSTVEIEKFSAFREAGINRVSVGVQALNDKDLKFLGRKHSAKEALQAIEIASKIFDRFSFDLIYARPGQVPEDWRAELTQALALARGHLSLYQLTIERSTPFYLDHTRGVFSIPDEDVAADFYLLTQEMTSQAGLASYEVSNHAAEGHQSRHNLTYWHYGDYIGIGPGAHGRLSFEGKKYATREHYAPPIWLERVEKSGMGGHPFAPLPAEERFTEALMMGLRLRGGVTLAHLDAQASGGKWRDYVDEERLSRVRAQGWLDYDSERLWLSVEGMLRLNALIPYILKAQPEAVCV
ncbi:MAG: coproporphyrinogen III oxidase [Alphaproteobacteria bacterium]|nr:coproporphyrinogen III oxidase [Alphaproteobacteria bacterium]